MNTKLLFIALSDTMIHVMEVLDMYSAAVLVFTSVKQRTWEKR